MLRVVKAPLVVGGLFLVFVMSYFPRALETRHPETSDLVIGIALTANHGTVSLRNKDGSFTDLGRIEGSLEYTKLMRRLASQESWHLSNPYNSLDDMWDDWPRQILRSVRKSIGLPASSEVAVIARFLKDILAHVEARVGRSPSALISFPALPGLFQEDIVDAVSYIGLRSLGNGFQKHPHEMVAAYAGNGLGLSTSCSGPGTCDKAGDKFEVRHTVLAEYTEAALLLHHGYMDKALEIPDAEMRLKVSFDLGSGRQPGEEDLRAFFLEFLSRVYTIGGSFEAPEKITVILTGSSDSVVDGKVENASKAAVLALPSKFEGFFDSSGYIAARGAAELAWRALSPEENMEI
ncbi:hypothetical protein FB567DRAFT_539471 [Paraphoma chrysanthemicola]|uniref:Uncharacterized protein n=1 Tax=Paraphoma chrysanthemicola TaxID=798071 RepID=A0A8K0VSA5_9PLEO|nr:hypothetical protein FB567DRAFT_539471 [Paraphoma chrysanthemicola]